MGGHGHDETYYLHAKHMYNLHRMKHQKLTAWSSVLGTVSMTSVSQYTQSSSSRRRRPPDELTYSQVYLMDIFLIAFCEVNSATSLPVGTAVNCCFTAGFSLCFPSCCPAHRFRKGNFSIFIRLYMLIVLVSTKRSLKSGKIGFQYNSVDAEPEPPFALQDG